MSVDLHHMDARRQFAARRNLIRLVSRRDLEILSDMPETWYCTRAYLELKAVQNWDGCSAQIVRDHFEALMKATYNATV